MDPMTVLTMTQTISTTQVGSGSLGTSYAILYLAVDPLQMFGVMAGLLLALVLFLFVNKFQQWALILALIAVLVWLPVSISGFSLIGAVIILFFILLSSVTRTIGNFFWK
jgi:hypothetical protein